ncbi:MAG: hypothetical protein HY238_13600 [Acidobacteria bacterium]|nr:hypothetical protein [Acidobacteriota bacterium]
MSHRYAVKGGFHFEEITFGNGVPVVIENEKAPAAAHVLVVSEIGEPGGVAEPIVTATPTVDPALETRALVAVPEPAPLSEPAPVAETWFEERFGANEHDVAPRDTDQVAPRDTGDWTAEPTRILDTIRELDKCRVEECEKLAHGIGVLREAGARQDSAMAAVTGRRDELSLQVAAVVERLDRQAEVIRSLCEAGSHLEASPDIGHSGTALNRTSNGRTV